LKQAAEASYQQLVLDEMLRGVPTRRLMRPPPEPLPESASLQRVVDERVLSEGERCVLLNRDGRVTGLLTVTDLRKFPRDEWPTTSAHRAMVPAEQVATVMPSTPVNESTRLMAERDVHQLPVIEGGQLVGLITRGDVLNYIQMRMQFGDAVDAAQAVGSHQDDRSI
jgi:CBS domain-containing protein